MSLSQGTAKCLWFEKLFCWKGPLSPGICLFRIRMMAPASLIVWPFSLCLWGVQFPTDSLSVRSQESAIVSPDPAWTKSQSSAPRWLCFLAFSLCLIYKRRRKHHPNLHIALAHKGFKRYKLKSKCFQISRLLKSLCMGSSMKGSTLENMLLWKAVDPILLLFTIQYIILLNIMLPWGDAKNFYGPGCQMTIVCHWTKVLQARMV